MSAGRGENKTRDALNVFVNGRHFHMLRGMTVQHALLAAGILKDRESCTVKDEQGNITGLDGALTEGIKLFTAKNNT